uniref:Uncharacterized protein n=1 Tax=Anguilla anguilla TaxID=7936 RepID=A0A0E9TV95_ANGAN
MCVSIASSRALKPFLLNDERDALSLRLSHRVRNGLLPPRL